MLFTIPLNERNKDHSKQSHLTNFDGTSKLDAFKVSLSLKRKNVTFLAFLRKDKTKTKLDLGLRRIQKLFYRPKKPFKKSYFA